MKTLETFTVILYDRTSNSVTTNACRRDLFCKGRSIGNIPPTSAALIKHALRSAYIAGHAWGQSNNPHQDLPSPVEWVWKEKDGKYIADWTDLPDAALGIRDLIRCSCNPQKECKGHCKCVKSEFPCTEL